MGVLNENAIMGASGVVDAYTIDNSCRFNSGDSPSLSRTPSGAGNQKTWTVSFWMKKTVINSGSMFIFSANATTELFWSSSTKKFGAQFTGGNFYLDGLQRDFAAWYHVVWVMDTTQSTDTNRMKVYINGTLQSISPSAWPSLNSDQHVNNTVAHAIGGRSSSSDYYDGYISEFHLVDGTALTASSFGETGDYGEWKPKRYSGHGTNGFYLNFADASDLGDDESGNGNDFSENNIVASDQVTDTPSNNFAVLNALAKATNHTYSEGNLKATGASAHNRAMSTIGFDSGKWYYEVLVLTYGNTHPSIGVVTAHADNALNTTYTGSDAGGFGYYSGGVNHNSSTNGGSYATYTGGDIIGIACDMDNLKVYFYKNGSNAITSGTAYETLVANTTYAFATSTNGSGVQVVNFGQDGTFAGNKTAQGNSDGTYGNFYHSVPSGFKALCSKNIAECAVIPSEHFGTVIYTGDGGSDRTISTNLSAVDFVWLKIRSGSDDFRLANTVTGGNKHLKSNAADVEATGTTVIKSFSGSTFNVGSDGAVNGNSSTYVAWCWKANGSGSSNEDGSINTTATSANPSAGISISTYTGTGSDATVGHGLSKAPELFMVKSRDSGYNWGVYSSALTSADYALQLNSQNAETNSFDYWNDLAPTSSVINIGTDAGSNSGDNYILYCFHSVESFSKIGVYAGNGSSSDGTFVYTGFRPSWIMLKRIDGTSHWRAHTSGNRTPPDVNGVFARLEVSGNGAEATSTSAGDLDFLSNGFKIKDGTAHVGASGNEYLFMAFAKTPFSHSNAV